MDALDYLTQFVNPLEFSLPIYLGVAVVKGLAEEVLNVIILQGLRLVAFPKLPSRAPKPIGKGLEFLEWKDFLFLGMNQFVELVFLLQLAKFALTLPRDLDQLNPLNTVGAFYALFFVIDLIYYFLHRFLHLRAVYPYIHKHHHRQPLPERGYVDAANENPIEQVGGLLCVWSGLLLVQPTFGLHSLSLFAFFACFAILSYLNHTPYDIKLGLFGLHYTVRAHETHHRMLMGNYAQMTMVWDKLFGTFIEYPTRKQED
jgi:sterol desaturase/sphingolipid hydroxylase (fatty acid hydroxylase superfamily)